VQGLDQLRRGDRFNIQATIPIDERGERDLKSFGGEYGRHLALEAKMGNLMKQATVTTIVQGAVVVTPAEVLRPAAAPGTPGAQAGVGRSQALSNSSRDLDIEAYIAVAPDQVTLLNEALAVGAELTAIASSGHPSDPGVSPPDHKPSSPLAIAGGTSFKMIESINGMKREQIMVPVKSDENE